jgi:hypothetical protein
MAERKMGHGRLLVTHRIPASAASAAVPAAVAAGAEKNFGVSAVIVDQNNVRIAFLRGE